MGAFGVNVNLDFTGGDNITGDLGLEQLQSVIEYVQSIFIDNSKNTKSLSITFSGTQYNITMKAGQQGIFPVIASSISLSWKAQSVGAGVIVPTIMMNIEKPPFLWQAV